MSNKNIPGFYFFCFIFLIVQSCNWHSLQLQPVSQPIYLGPQITSFGETDSSAIDSIGLISGICMHQKEKETVSQSENITIALGGKDYTKENINSSIKTALQDDPNRFIANGQMLVEIEYGISVGAVLSFILAEIITNGESELGYYTNESIYFLGTVYRIKDQKNIK
jgi:hypothetical protein